MDEDEPKWQCAWCHRAIVDYFGVGYEGPGRITETGRIVPAPDECCSPFPEAWLILCTDCSPG